MSTTQDITFGVTGQDLVYVAPEGRPSAVSSVSVYWHRDGDDDTAESAIDGSASIDSVSTTVDSASGASETNPRRLALASTSDIDVGSEYLVTNTSGAGEWVEVTGVDSDGVDVRYPLTHDYATSSTFVGTRITATVDATWVADESHLPEGGLDPRPDYRVRWVYTVDSKTYAKDSYFRLVRYAGRHEVTPLDVAKRSSAFALDQQRYEDRGERLIDAAYERVQADLYNNDLGDHAIRDRQVINELTIRMTLMLHQLDRLYQGGGNADAITAAETDYNTYLNRVIQANTRAPFDSNADGAGNQVPRQGLWNVNGVR